MVKVNIISGFLGAGKTTLIKKLLTGSVAKEKIILLENEYGEVGVDGSFMKDSGIIVDELNSGCICCTLVGDFQKAVDDLIAKYHPDRLLIEPSGVGKLSEILAAVERAKERHSDLVVTGCATVVDAGKCRMYMKNFGEFFLDQIKTSATVIFSRTQLLSAERIEKSRALVEEQHPGVRIVTTPWDDLSADTLLEVIESGKPMEIHLDDDDDDDDEDEHEHHHHHHDHDDHDHEDGVCPCCGGHHDDDDDDDHEQFDEGEALLALGAAIQRIAYALHNEPFFPIGRTYRGTVQLRMVHSDSSLRYFPLWGWLAHITNNSQRSRIDIVCSTRCSASIAPMMFHPPFSSQPRIKLFQYDCITPLHTITTVRFRNMR